jgi:hypothetical protein
MKKAFKYFQVSCADGNGHQGYTYRTSKKDAEIAAQNFLDTAEEGDKFADAKIREIEVEPTKRGILNALLVLADHPNNA